MTKTPTEAEPLLRIASMSKAYGENLVLDDVRLTLHAGEVHALLGQNGCGKSTLIKVLAQATDPEPGSIAMIDGTEVSLGSLTAEQRHRLHFIHQDLSLVPEMNALDNLALGPGYPSRAGFIRWGRHREACRRHLAELDADVDLTVPVGGLSVVERTTIAIARATAGWISPRSVLVLDEPTAKLPPADVDRLFGVVERLASRGAAVLLVTHRLDEVMRICDRATILRDGTVVEDVVIAETSASHLIEAMVGRRVDELTRRPQAQLGAPVLAIRELTSETVEGLTVDVRRGEVVGVAGLDGSGRAELAELLFDGADAHSGEVVLDGRVLPTGPSARIAAGMALVPAERTTAGCIPEMTAAHNSSMAALGRFTWRTGWLRSRGERSASARMLDRVEFSPMQPSWPLTRFSGGNQQKVVFAKWLMTKPTVFVLDEPVQGVDIGAKASIFGLVAEAAHDGLGVLVCSAVIEDLALICDRIVVMSFGRHVGEVACMGKDISAIANKVLTLMNRSDAAV